jgi:hypothetical protein
MRCHELTAPWVIDRPLNRSAFDIYIETQLVPTLRKGDIVILDSCRRLVFPKTPSTKASGRPSAFPGQPQLRPDAGVSPND